VEQTGSLDPDKGVLFPADKANMFARTCSRSGPGPISGTWLPSASEINELEERLPDSFGRHVPPDIHLHASDYYRQYGGLEIAGRKVIYVNALANVADASQFPIGSRMREREDWRTGIQVVCDDGVNFGAEYDPMTRRFDHFEFDGCMCTRATPANVTK
jgi:hypothetical protein